MKKNVSSQQKSCNLAASKNIKKVKEKFSINREGEFMENSSFYTVSNIETSHKPTAQSNDEILRIFNKRRPYCPSDFKKQHFIPKLDKGI